MSRDFDVVSQSKSARDKLLKQLMREAALAPELRKQLRKQAMERAKDRGPKPLDGFLVETQIPVAGRYRRALLNPKRFKASALEFRLIERNGEHLKYLGQCPRCDEGTIEVSGTFKNGKTEHEVAPHLCLECEDRLDELLEGRSKTRH